MKSQLQHDAQWKMETAEQSELTVVSGGVMPVYDEQGAIIRTCTGPVGTLLTMLGLIRLR
jgi:hypothetical protein